MKPKHIGAALVVMLLVSGQAIGVENNTPNTPPANAQPVVGTQVFQGGMMMMMGMWASPPAPVINSDGTIYTIATAGFPMFFAGPVNSTLTQIRTDGSVTNLALAGNISAPLITGSNLIVTSSGIINGGSSVNIYAIPFAQGAVPISVTLQGNLASKPAVVGNLIYIRTRTATFMMMNNMMFATGTPGPSFLYVVNLNGTIVLKTAL